MAKPEKPIPDEMKDIAKTVREECKSLDELHFNISIKRTRPYSRLAAIVLSAPETLTLAEYCRGKGETEVVNYVRWVGACRKPEVRIYRGGSEILAGDWVAFEFSYAESHGTPVYEKTVPLEDLVWALGYEKEWYYIPHHLVNYFKSIEEFWVNLSQNNEMLATKKWKLRAEAERLLKEIREEKTKHGV